MTISQSLAREGEQEIQPTIDQDMIHQLVKTWIEFSIRDGEETSVNASEKVGALQHQMQHIQSCIAAIGDNPGDTEALMMLNQAVSQVQSEVARVMVAMQFYDRVSQRLQHAKHFLNVGEKGTEADFTAVLAMEDERVLFDAVKNGLSENDAIALAEKALNKTVDDSVGDDSIELF